MSIFLALYSGSVSGFGGPAHSPVTQDEEPSEGARLLQSACTLCHDLGGITENPGIYSRAAFRELVRAMVDYGAPLDEAQMETLIDYLAVTYGRERQEP